MTAFRMFDTAFSTPGETRLAQLASNVLMYALNGSSGEGNPEQFFYPLESYLSHAPETVQEFQQKGIAIAEQLRTTGGWKVKDEEMQKVYGDATYMAQFYALHRFVNVGVDMDKEDKGYPSALFTRDVNLLQSMASRGDANPEEVEKAIKHLEGNKTSKALLEGKFVAARLDLDGVVDGAPKFKVVIPTSSFTIGSNGSFIFIPVPFFYIFDNIVHQGGNIPFRFTKDTVDGTKTYTATVSRRVVEEIYGDKEPQAIETRFKKIKVGYDPLRMRYTAYDLESSVHSSGISSFRPEMLDKLEGVRLHEIDTSRHMIDFTLLRGIFRTRVNESKQAELDTLNLIDLSGYSTVKDKKIALIDYADNLSERDLYFVMKGNSTFFKDMDESLKTRERVKPRFLKGFTYVDPKEYAQANPDVQKGDFVETSVAALHKMMNTGVVKLTASKKNGGTMEIVASNNPDVLAKMLGKDYVAKFESASIKLAKMKSLIADGKVAPTQDSLSKMAVMFNVTDLLNMDDYFPASDTPKDQVLVGATQAIEGATTVLKEKAASRKSNPSMVTVRNIHATEDKEFYRSVDVRNLISVEFSAVEAKK